MDELLAAIIDDRFRSALYVHATPPLLDTLAERYAIEDAEPHLKLALGRTDLLAAHAARSRAPRRGPTWTRSRRSTRRPIPGTWFVPRMLATGRYVGIRRDGRLVCVAGVHVHSPTWGVAALGNVATLPELRGQGLARGACAALCLLLLADGIETIALNVRADNAAAIAAYTRLGFEPVAAYVGGEPRARTAGG